MNKWRMGLAGVLAGMLHLAIAGSSSAQDKSSADILNALISPAEEAAEEDATSPEEEVAPGAAPSYESPAPDAGRKSKPRRKQVARRARPSVDIAIQFEYNSAVLAPAAMRQLIELGEALTSPQLAYNQFIVAGHTDATGDADYNQQLSEKRAAAVRSFLVQNFSIPSRRLMAVGYGESQLRNPDRPRAAVNRRVQIINAGG